MFNSILIIVLLYSIVHDDSLRYSRKALPIPKGGAFIELNYSVNHYISQNNIKINYSQYILSIGLGGWNPDIYWGGGCLNLRLGFSKLHFNCSLDPLEFYANGEMRAIYGGNPATWFVQEVDQTRLSVGIGGIFETSGSVRVGLEGFWDIDTQVASKTNYYYGSVYTAKEYWELTWGLLYSMFYATGDIYIFTPYIGIALNIPYWSAYYDEDWDGLDMRRVSLPTKKLHPKNIASLCLGCEIGTMKLLNQPLYLEIRTNQGDIQKWSYKFGLGLRLEQVMKLINKIGSIFVAS